MIGGRRQIGFKETRRSQFVAQGQRLTPYPTGRIPNYRFPGHFVPGYDRPAPSEQKTFATRPCN